jgi:hypothetical protein
MDQSSDNAGLPVTSALPLVETATAVNPAVLRDNSLQIKTLLLLKVLDIGDTEAPLHASKEAGLEVNPEKTKYMLMSRYKKAGQKHSIKIANRSFEGVAKFIYLGTTLTDQNCMNEEIKRRLNSGNACYHSVQSLLSSNLLSSNLNFKIFRTLILPVVLY